MSIPIIWPGSGSAVSGSTPFGFYDTDSQFTSDALNAANWAARRLGYPVVDIELSDLQLYAAFEESTTEYGSTVNDFNIRENILNLQGSVTSSNLSGREVRGNINKISKMISFYGSEVGAGGDVDWYSGSIDLIPGQQTYNLDALWATPYESGSEIRIKRIFHYNTPASLRYQGSDYLNSEFMNNELGFNSISYDTLYILRPLFDDLLRMQRIELSDAIRKSAYSFEIINNKLRLFPRPITAKKLWFQYVIVNDADVGFTDSVNKITDHHNVPYNNLVYSYINSVGKQWIKKFFLAICKEILGHIRGKYQTVPIPNSSVTLDGDSLRTEAQTEKQKLIEELKETLEKTNRRYQLESKNEEDDNLQKIIGKIPLPIYIG